MTGNDTRLVRALPLSALAVLGFIATHGCGGFFIDETSHGGRDFRGDRSGSNQPSGFGHHHDDPPFGWGEGCHRDDDGTPPGGDPGTPDAGTAWPDSGSNGRPDAGSSAEPDAGSVIPDAGAPPIDGGVSTDAGSPADSGPPPEPCLVDEHCGAGSRCVEQICQPCPDGICPCRSASDCASDELCVEATGRCEPKPCSAFTTEADCMARADCQPIYGGQDCTDSSGGECTSGDVDCTCERFSFALCGARAL